MSRRALFASDRFVGRAILLVFCLSAGVASAQTPARKGVEFQVNSYTTGSQQLPSLAGVGTAGDFVVVWGGPDDADGLGVFGQRFASDGTKLGAEFQVDSHTASFQTLPSVAGVGTAGHFVVAWQSFNQDGSGYGIFGQRFAADGSKQGAEFQVNSHTNYGQERAAVAGVGTAGDFVVTWVSNAQDGNEYGVFGQRFASDGTKQGAEFQVNSYTTGSQFQPTVAGVGTAGDFVVAWQSVNQDGNSHGVFGQRFASDGTKQGPEFQVNTHTPSQQRDPTVAGVGTAGDFVVAWSSENQGGGFEGVFGQRFASDGTKQGAEFQVNTFFNYTQRRPAVAAVGTAGDFVVAWQSVNQDGDNYGIFGQRFAANGTKQGAEFPVNSHTAYGQEFPAVAGVGTAGDFVVAWQSSYQDGNSSGVFGQRFWGALTLVDDDMSGDLKSDVLWRHKLDGSAYAWLMNGNLINSEAGLGTVPTDYKIVGRGQFGAGGKADILWHSSVSGAIYVWRMNGTTVLVQEYVGMVADTNWEIVGSSDHDGDFKADILWRNKTTGDVYLWRMNGSSVLAQEYVGTVGDTNWEIVGSGDHSGDGKADILYRHKTSGVVYLWRMNGSSVLAQEYVVTVADTDWEVAGTSDHDGDVKADILWRNATSGVVYLYRLNGASIVAQEYVTTIADTNWEIVGSGDYDGSGQADILWRNKTSGVVYLYRMNGATVLAQEYAGTVPDTNWEVANPR